MTTSSAQEDYLTTLDDITVGNITIDVGNSSTYGLTDTITLDTSNITLSSGSGYNYNMGTVVIGGGLSNSTIGTISTSSISDFNIGINIPEEWVNCFPDWERVQQMCEMYPGLKIAFERLKVVYDLVKDDFDAPPEKRIKP